MDILSCSRKIDRMVSFDFIYELLVAYYSAAGRLAIYPVGIVQNASGRISVWDPIRTAIGERVTAHYCYRWFCGFEPEGTISLYSVGIPIHETRSGHKFTPKCLTAELSSE